MPIVGYAIVKDEPEQIVVALDRFAAQPDCQAILFNGGTGIAQRDTTFDVIAGRLEKTLVGFGELFRMLSLRTDRRGGHALARHGRCLSRPARLLDARLVERRRAGHGQADRAASWRTSSTRSRSEPRAVTTV